MQTGFPELLAAWHALSKAAEKILFFCNNGNDGSATNTQYPAAEFVNRFRRDRGALAATADEAFVVPSRETSRIQKAHIILGHAWCALTEELLAGASAAYSSAGGADR